MFSWSMSCVLVVYSNMDACLYCFGYNILACCGFGGLLGFACRFLPNCPMSFDLVLGFRCFGFGFGCVRVIGAFGINCRMSDAFFLSWLFASCRAFLINGVLLVSHCFMAAVVLVSQSSISVWKGIRSWTSKVASCWYNALILVNKASRVALLDAWPVDGPWSFSFRAFHRKWW